MKRLVRANIDDKLCTLGGFVARNNMPGDVHRRLKRLFVDSTDRVVVSGYFFFFIKNILLLLFIFYNKYAPPADHAQR